MDIEASKMAFEDDAEAVNLMHGSSSDVFGDEAYGFLSGGKISDLEDAEHDKDQTNTHQDEHEGVASIVVPTKILSIVILVFLIITHICLWRECAVASKSLMTSKKEGNLSSRVITSWRVLPGNDLNVRSSIHVTSNIVQKFPGHEAETMEFEVYGKPQILQGGTKRVHIISPVNGWATEITNHGRRYMEPLHKEELLESDDNNDLEKTHLPLCPLFDAGYATISLSKYHYAPTSLVVAQQLWNASQVFHLFLLISLYGVMTSPSSFSSTSMKSMSQLVSEKKRKAILWCFLILLSALSMILLPFSVYFISPGGHAFAAIMAIVSLATAYLSPPNVRFYLADLPPQCCTPRQHPGTLMKSEELSDERSHSVNNNLPSSTNTFTSADVVNHVVVSGRGLCKVELIAFMCNLGSSMYNYNTSKDHVFPYWNNIFHAIDKWLGLTGGKIKLNYEVPGRFMFNMGIKSYHQPLFMPLTFGSTTGGYIFVFLWSILPFIYTFYFMSMYVLAKRVPGVRLQRFFALWGVFHFLFLTDVVDYKYGRGLRNEPHEYFHKNEVVAWRIAILLPIYQNVLSGHYRHPQRNRYIGTVLHYFMATWAIIFFVYQFLLNDCERIPQWLLGKKPRSALSMLGLRYNYNLGYLGTCMVMVYVYGFMMFGGTWCHHVFVGQEDIDNRSKGIWKTPVAGALRALVTPKLRKIKS